MTKKEPRIVDLATHSRKWVSLRVAATYLEVDRKTLGKYLETRLLAFTWFGGRRRIAVAELAAFEQRQHVGRKGN